MLLVLSGRSQGFQENDRKGFGIKFQSVKVKRSNKGEKGWEGPQEEAMAPFLPQRLLISGNTNPDRPSLDKTDADD